MSSLLFELCSAAILPDRRQALQVAECRAHREPLAVSASLKLGRVSNVNVDLVMRVYDALRADDLETALAYIDTDVEYVNPEYAVDAGTRRGHAGIRANIANMSASFEWWRFDPEEFIAIGDHVVVVGRFRAQGKDSGLTIDRRQSRLWTLRGGRVVRYAWFDGPLEAAAVADELG